MARSNVESTCEGGDPVANKVTIRRIATHPPSWVASELRPLWERLVRAGKCRTYAAAIAYFKSHLGKHHAA